MPVNRNDWKITPLPIMRTALVLERAYTDNEFSSIMEGKMPEVFEDHWFIFYEEPYLYLHRSWTGVCIYQVRFETTNDGARVVEALVNRDVAQWRETSDARDAALLSIHLDGRAGRNVKNAMLEYFKPRGDRKRPAP